MSVMGLGEADDLGFGQCVAEDAKQVGMNDTAAQRKDVIHKGAETRREHARRRRYRIALHGSSPARGGRDRWDRCRDDIGHTAH
jgi:hypothetical protein